MILKPILNNYQLTKGGKQNNNPSFESYYYLDTINDKLIQRHDLAEDEDDFSAYYLLNKSFGE